MEVNKGANVRKGQCKAIRKVVCTEEDPRDFSMARVVALLGGAYNETGVVSRAQILSDVIWHAKEFDLR